MTSPLCSPEDVGTEDEGEDQFVFLKQRATHVTVEAVREVVRQEPDALLKRLGLVARRRHKQLTR